MPELGFMTTETPAGLLLILVVGLVVGSFLNVVILRLPIMMQAQWRKDCRELLACEPEPASEPFNLATPGSHCPACQTPIKPWYNVPVLSWLILRGRCSYCQSEISSRYPLVELASGIASVVVATQFEWGSQLALALVFTWSLLCLTLIDWDHQLLPDDITLPLLWLGLMANFWGIFTDLESAVLGAVLGYGILWSVYWIFKLLTKKEGMGYGDFKLLAALGAWLGWQALPMIILLSSLVGATIGIGLIVLKRLQRDQPMPFGPYLAAAGWLFLMMGDRLTQWSLY